MSATRFAVSGTARRSLLSRSSCWRSASAPTRPSSASCTRAAGAAAVSRARSARPDLGDQSAAELDARDRGAGELARLAGPQSIVRGDCVLPRLRRQGAGHQRRDADRGRRAGPGSRHGGLRELLFRPRRRRRSRPDLHSDRRTPRAQRRHRPERWLLAAALCRRCGGRRPHDRSRRRTGAGHRRDAAPV